MVGDRISSDIEGGRRAGLATILVLSGASQRGRGGRRDPPDHVVDDLAAPAAVSDQAPETPARIARPGLAFAGIFAVTFCGLLAVGAVLPVLPRYVHGPLGAGNIAVGVVIGSYAITGLLLRPSPAASPTGAGASRPSCSARCWSPSAASSTCCRSGWPGLIVARLVLGAGEGSVFTAGSAWIVDLAPPDRRGRVIGLYGLAVWAGLSIGPAGRGAAPADAAGYTAVWLFAGAMPLLGALIASRVPDPFRPRLADARAPPPDRPRGGAARASRSRSPRSATPRSPPSSSSTSKPAASATGRWSSAPSRRWSS